MYGLREKLFWMEWPCVQLIFRLLAHHGFRPVPEALSFLHRFFHRIGDTKIIEDTNKKARSVEQGGCNRVAKTLSVAHEIRGEPPVQRKRNNSLFPVGSFGCAGHVYV